MHKHTKHAQDYIHNKDADVVKHGSGMAIGSEHWVQEVGPSVFARGYGDDPAGAFLARPAKDRAQPHKKINECDH